MSNSGQVEPETIRGEYHSVRLHAGIGYVPPTTSMRATRVPNPPIAGRRARPNHMANRLPPITTEEPTMTAQRPWSNVSPAMRHQILETLRSSRPRWSGPSKTWASSNTQFGFDCSWASAQVGIKPDWTIVECPCRSLFPVTGARSGKFSWNLVCPSSRS